MEADINFDMHYATIKSHGKDEKHEDIPVKVMVGVTVSLCGLFLVFVPIPICQTAGGWLINTGIGILGSDALDRWDAYDKEQRKRDR